MNEKSCMFQNRSLLGKFFEKNILKKIRNYLKSRVRIKNKKSEIEIILRLVQLSPQYFTEFVFWYKDLVYLTSRKIFGSIKTCNLTMGHLQINLVDMNILSINCLLHTMYNMEGYNKYRGPSHADLQLQMSINVPLL